MRIPASGHPQQHIIGERCCLVTWCAQAPPTESNSGWSLCALSRPTMARHIWMILSSWRLLPTPWQGNNIAEEEMSTELWSGELRYRPKKVYLFWSKKNTTFSESSNLVYLWEEHMGKETLECGKQTGWNYGAGVKNMPCPIYCVGRICAKMWEDLIDVRFIYLKTGCYCRHHVQMPFLKWVRHVTRMTVFYSRPTTPWWWRWWNGCLQNIDSGDYLPVGRREKAIDKRTLNVRDNLKQKERV